MSRTKRGRTKKKRRATAGSFRPGPDPRRHRFTQSDCRIGWWVANILHPELRDWLRMRLFIYYSSKRRRNGQEETGRCAVGDHSGAADSCPF